MINLTNILVNRRMKEILVMRVNGFSMRQAICYLASGTAFSTLVGIIISVAAGIPFSQALVRSLSSTTITLSDAVIPYAWVISVAMSIVFAVIINAVSFRKIGKTPLVNNVSSITYWLKICKTDFQMLCKCACGAFTQRTHSLMSSSFRPSDEQKCKENPKI